MKRGFWLLALLAVLLAPVLLRQREAGAGRGAEETLVVITPHNEAIRSEFARAFAAHHLARSGKRVRVDYRTPGGTSEIARFVSGEYVAAFRTHWTKELGRPWGTVVERNFSNAKAPADDPLAQEARRAFLGSRVSSRLDVFFGGGAYDFQSQAAAGFLVDSGLLAAMPEVFGPGGVPQSVGGEPYYDAGGRWLGTAVSSFGIVYNTDSLARLGIAGAPRRWADLGDPRYRRQIALANPTQSGSVNKSFEMLIQEQMQESVSTQPTLPEPEAVAQGWTRAMRLLMRIGANARYFTDSSTKISIDVGAGEAAAGMTIDFYGRFQSGASVRADGTSPVRYVTAAGGSSFGVDPIGMFRGAPHPELAREFMAFVLSSDGQKLWNWKVGAPGGPHQYALRRLPVLPSLYGAEWRAFRSDPEVNPYGLAQAFTYHEKWTAPLFRSIAFIFRCMCIDSHEELVEAWQALAEAGFPPEATAAFEEVGAVDYAAAGGPIRAALGGAKIQEVELARELAGGFRSQYRRAAELARAGR